MKARTRRSSVLPSLITCSIPTLTFFAAFADELDRADESIWPWAPWTGARMRTLLDTLAVVVQRGARVVTFVRGVKDQMQGRPAFQGNAAALRAIGVRVTEYQDMHQKIVVIDRRTTMIGSLNALSHNRTREVMVVHDGRMFAERLLQHEYAAELSKVPLCAQCGARHLRSDDTRRFPHCGLFAVFSGLLSVRSCRRVLGC